MFQDQQKYFEYKNRVKIIIIRTSTDAQRTKYTLIKLAKHSKLCIYAEHRLFPHALFY